MIKFIEKYPTLINHNHHVKIITKIPIDRTLIELKTKKKLLHIKQKEMIQTLLKKNTLRNLILKYKKT